LDFRAEGLVPIPARRVRDVRLKSRALPREGPFAVTRAGRRLLPSW
jgi:hypothetical protein